MCLSCAVPHIYFFASVKMQASSGTPEQEHVHLAKKHKWEELSKVAVGHDHEKAIENNEAETFRNIDINRVQEMNKKKNKNKKN